MFILEHSILPTSVVLSFLLTFYVSCRHLLAKRNWQSVGRWTSLENNSTQLTTSQTGLGVWKTEPPVRDENGSRHCSVGFAEGRQLRALLQQRRCWQCWWPRVHSRWSAIFTTAENYPGIVTCCLIWNVRIGEATIWQQCMEFLVSK